MLRGAEIVSRIWEPERVGSRSGVV